MANTEKSKISENLQEQKDAQELAHRKAWRNLLIPAVG